MADDTDKLRHSRTVSVGDAGSLFGSSTAGHDFFGSLSGEADHPTPLDGIGEEAEEEEAHVQYQKQNGYHQHR
jgi:hypothetical protein